MVDHFFFKFTAPPAPFVGFVNNITASINNITIWNSLNINGQIKAYQVIVVEVVVDTLFDVTKLTNYKKAKEDKLHYYIAAEISTNPDETFPQIFTLGDGKQYNGYKNMKLEKGNKYNVSQRALTRDENMVRLNKRNDYNLQVTVIWEDVCCDFHG
jgi:hypothetical protein